MRLSVKILNLLFDINPFYIYSFSFTEMILLYSGIFIIIFLISKFQLNKQVLIKCFSSFVIILFVFLLIKKYSFSSTKDKICIIDISRGEAILLKNQKTNYLFLHINNYKLFQRKILPVLLKKNSANIDYLIFPYYQKDFDKIIKLLKPKKIITNDNRICKKEKNCFKAKEGFNLGNIKVIFPPSDKYYLLNFKNSSIVIEFKNILITYNFTKDIAEYISMKYKKNFKILIAYKSEVKNFTEKDLIISKRDEKGYLEIFPNNDYKISNYITIEEKASFFYFFKSAIKNNIP